jgi:regulator of sigma D
MLSQVEAAKQNWGGKSATIDKWLYERQNLLIQYCHLAGLDTVKGALPEAADISEFCTILMDYLSVGHFEVYEMLVENDESGALLKAKIYPLIAETTEKALNFNDNFADSFTPEQANNFDKALDSLGEVLEERFALEDQLIQHMHNNLKSKTIAP